MKKVVSFLILMMLLILSSCSSDDAQETEEVVTSNNITIRLTWSPNTVDLDLSLDRSGTRFSISESETPGESLEIQASDPNGTYAANIFYFTGSETVQYTFAVVDGNNSEIFATTKTAPPSNGSLNTPIDIISIVKNGDEFMITDQ